MIQLSYLDYSAVEGKSFLHRLSPVVKIFGMLLVLFAIVTVRNLPGLFVYRPSEAAWSPVAAAEPAKLGSLRHQYARRRAMLRDFALTRRLWFRFCRRGWL